MKFKPALCLLLATSACFSLTQGALTVTGTLNLNFGAQDGTTSRGSSDQAGLIGNEGGNSVGSTLSSNWNNLSGASSSSSSLVYSDGSTATGVSVTWTSNNTWALPNVTGGSNATGNPTMMKGYIESTDPDGVGTKSVDITVSGLSYTQPYSVIVYFDSQNVDYVDGSPASTLWKKATYAIEGTSTSFLVEDTEWTDFNAGSGNNADGIFQIPDADGTGNLVWPTYPDNNREGNFVIFSGITGSSFTLTATPGDSESMELQRAFINGIQVVPEPAAWSIILGLIAFAGVVFFRRPGLK